MKKILPFEKYQAIGNDFIIFDCMEKDLIDYQDVILRRDLCDRRFGIGADGIIALTPSQQFDFKMLYYNSDGQPSSFCGNGSRCAISYMAGKLEKQELIFEAADGLHKGFYHGKEVSVQMRDIDQFEKTELGFFVFTGSPHLVIEVTDLENMDVQSVGRQIRNSYPKEGSNVNFIQNGPDGIKVRTYERGVEDETLSCGTGMTAAAYYCALKEPNQWAPQYIIHTKGGEAKVSMTISGQKASQVMLKGPAERVFSGFYDLNPRNT
ncbi:MAG: diaminopimelate epimerase [Saprospiraceae bacterium]|nr:diaminopimelate epimerase [Saprospiraceae bacterium]